MSRYVVGRVVALPFLLLGISLIVFISVYIIPGDAVQVIGGLDATEEELQAIRERLGLDRPPHVQFFVWLNGILTGDFGTSIITNQPVLPELVRRYRATLQLAVVGISIAIVVGIPAGIVAGARANTAVDLATMLVSLIGVSIPAFWMGVLLMMIFAVRLNWFPVAGRGGLSHIVLPGITISSTSIAIIARMTRSCMLEVLRQQYIVVARGKGCSEPRVILIHALKNASLPILTVIGLQFGYLMGGAVITETVFHWPGIGRLLVMSIHRRDIPMIQGAVLVIAFTFAVVNLLTDLLYRYLDPRITYK